MIRDLEAVQLLQLGIREAVKLGFGWLGTRAHIIHQDEGTL
jgi:hypothetical protein